MSRGERGQLAGIETVPLGILVFVAGTLLVVNAWAVVTNRTTANSIAREYLRAYTNAPDRTEGLAAGARVARTVATAHDLPAERVRLVVPDEWGPCVVATVAVTISVPEVRAPFLGGFGTTEVTVVHHDRISGHRAERTGAGGTNACG